MITLVIADDHPIVLNGLVGLFGGESDINIVATCVNGNEALEAVRRFRPHVLVVDLRMPLVDGLEVARAIAKESLATRVVLLSALLSDEDTIDALRSGVKGFVLKEVAAQVIVQCVRRVASGGQWLDDKASARAIGTLLRREEAERTLARALTPREVDVVRLAGQGVRNAEIGERLDISEGTVKAHLHNIYRKLEIESRVELVLYAREHGLT
jgi:DNA-binding NarL/FixJ family response regulator